ncbi:MAG: lyase [Betaproteobacteria bacterium]|jgi:virginiamycin B lyase|nr:lyase [Betaproteobacteria bacterium]
MRLRSPLLSLLLLVAACAQALAAAPVYYDVPKGSHPHDVAADPAPGGAVYYTAQHAGKLGILDPKSGRIDEVPLGARSSPHGVIVGPDGAAWITDSGRNALIRFDPATRKLTEWPLPADAGNANLNTATFDRRGRLWFTGQSGIYGRLDPATGTVRVWPAPGGRGPYGITTTPAGDVWYCSLAGSHIAQIDVDTGQATVVAPPTAQQGARRVWSDSRGRIWVSYWNTGHVGRYDPATRSWKEWRLPGSARVYSVWVDPDDIVWLTEWIGNAIVRFDPATEKFTPYPSNRDGANVRQMLGRKGEAWGAESGTDRLVMVPAS